MTTTVHIFQDGEFNGVNAKQDGKWLAFDDAFTTLQRARQYAQRLAQNVQADKIVYDWNGEELPRDYISK
jgi:hypothetical protein